MGHSSGRNLHFTEVSYRVRYGAPEVRSLRKVRVNLYRSTPPYQDKSEVQPVGSQSLWWGMGLLYMACSPHTSYIKRSLGCFPLLSRALADWCTTHRFGRSTGTTAVRGESCFLLAVRGHNRRVEKTHLSERVNDFAPWKEVEDADTARSCYEHIDSAWEIYCLNMTHLIVFALFAFFFNAIK